jgi:hypothetical protein
MIPGPLTPLHEVRDWLRERVKHGAECPCCAQYAKVYRRKINASMAVGLIRMYRMADTDWVHVPDLNLPGGDLLKTRYWGLIESHPEITEREDGSKRVGIWRLTGIGERFVLGGFAVPKYAHIYANRALNYSGPPVSIREALGDRFDYRELMDS